MNGPAWAACKYKVDSGRWPTATEYRAYLEEKGVRPAEVRSRVLNYAREPEFDIRAEVEAEAAEAEFLASLRSFRLG